MTQKLIDKYPNTCYTCEYRKSIKTFFRTRHYCKRQPGKTKYGIRHIQDICGIKNCSLYKTVEPTEN